MKYKYLDHTADAKFQAFGKSLEEAFENAALAAFNIIVKTEDVKPEIIKEIKEVITYKAVCEETGEEVS